MKINRIVGEECKTTRPLWEDVFYEDSQKFTEYYFENKAEKNIGYVIGQAPYDAMMFRTPYPLIVEGKQLELSYIVGVATRKECRHRGYMRELLMHSFREMYEEKQPFAFLMPANPEIYKPFDFQYVYDREDWKLKDPEKQNWKDVYSVAKIRRQMPNYPIMERLAEFANRYLEKHYSIYVHRDAEYYELQLKESLAQNGDIYVLFEQGDLKAFFLYAKEGEEIFLQEVIEEKEGILSFLQKAEKKKPIIMARIIHLEEMMKLVRSKENKSIIIQIEDELLAENAGIYQWDMTPKGSNIVKIQSFVGESKADAVEVKAAERMTIVPDVSMHIKDFATKFLKGVFINEIV